MRRDAIMLILLMQTLISLRRFKSSASSYNNYFASSLIFAKQPNLSKQLGSNHGVLNIAEPFDSEVW